MFLGETLDPENITADYTAGVLTLRIPVMEAAKPRKVAISSKDAPAPPRARASMEGRGPASVGSARGEIGAGPPTSARGAARLADASKEEGRTVSDSLTTPGSRGADHPADLLPDLRGAAR